MGHRAASPNRFSSLILAQYDERGKIAYAGLVGTGLSQEARSMLLTQLHALKRKTCPCAPVPILRDHVRELRTDLPPQGGQAGARRAGGVSEAHRGGIAPRGAQWAAPRSVATAGGPVDALMTTDRARRQCKAFCPGRIDMVSNFHPTITRGLSRGGLEQSARTCIHGRVWCDV